MNRPFSANPTASSPALEARDDWSASDGHTAPVGQPGATIAPMIVGGRYQLLRLLAEGGSGKVYEARATTTSRRCALKLLSKLSGDPGVLRHLEREARTTAYVESDHIVQVFDAGIDGSLRVPYIAMELLRGEDLKTALARLGRFEPDIALRLVLQAATGLARAHALGIVHRDVKPANLFLTERDTGELCVKVLDFGIAKVRGACELELGEANSTQGALVGTPRYMSPEQLRRDENVDARTDVWSLAAVLHEMLSGQPPFAHAHSLAELTSAVLVFRVGELARVAPWVSSEVAELVGKALAPDAQERFTDCGEFRDALSRLVTDTRVQRQTLQPLPASAPALVPLDTQQDPALTPAQDLRAQRGETLRSVESGQSPSPRSRGAARFRFAAPVALAALTAALFSLASRRTLTPSSFSAPKSEVQGARPTTRELLRDIAPRLSALPLPSASTPSALVERRPRRELRPSAVNAASARSPLPAPSTRADTEFVSDRIRTSVDEFK